MLSHAILERLVNNALSSGGEYADVFFEHRESLNIVLEDDRVESLVSGITTGVGIRLIRGGNTFFAISNDMSSEGALLDMAKALGRASTGGGVAVAFGHAVAKGGMSVLRMPGDVETERKVKLVEAANRAARAASPLVRQAKIVYRDSVQSVRIATSEGRIVQDNRVHSVGIAQVVAERDGIVETGYEPIGGHMGYEIFDNEALERAAKTATERAVSLLGARRAPGGRMPVVISSEAGGTMIHEAIGHGLEADLAGQGVSRFSGMIGKQVASTLVSVIDDGTLEGRRGSAAFDDEGCPCARNVLVENGILRGYMYDKLSTLRYGGLQTGNGRRESYRHRPIPRMTNTFIAPGQSDPAEIVRSVAGRGLLVKKMGGGQVNTVNGDFVFDVLEGYILENGRTGELVRGATLTGNGPSVLMSIDMVGSDLGFSIGTCGKDSQGVPVSDAMPTLRIPEMVVGGEV